MNLYHGSLFFRAAFPFLLLLPPVPLRAEDAAAPRPSPGRLEAEMAAIQGKMRLAQNYQSYSRPPGEIGESEGAFYPGEQPQEGPQDSSGLLIRLGRLESQMRQINGQIEQMQFETRRLEEQLKKFQEDVDFRFRDGAQHAPAQKRGEAGDPQINGGKSASPQRQNSTAGGTRANRQSDAFDPSQDPMAPGAPRPLGTLAANHVAQGSSDDIPVGADPGAPLDLPGSHSRAAGEAPDSSRGLGPEASPAGKPMAGLPATPKREYEVAMISLKSGAFADAEKGFGGFLERHPKDKLAPDATYYLGESFYLRGRRREAAEQFLKVSTQYGNSPRVPQALLRLGESLRALGAKEQACATFDEIPRKYPDAPPMIKTEAAQEAKRTPC